MFEDNITKNVADTYKELEEVRKDTDELEPRAKGEKDFKALHKVKDNDEEDENDSEDGVNEDKDKYKEFFNKALKKWKVDSPEDIEDKAERKKFFNWVDDNYKAKNESTELEEESEELVESTLGKVVDEIRQMGAPDHEKIMSELEKMYKDISKTMSADGQSHDAKVWMKVGGFMRLAREQMKKRDGN